MNATARVQASLARIAATDGRVNAFTAVLAERALAQAARVDAGDVTGPLAGMPFAVKNLFDLQGIATLAGSKIERDAAPAARDAVLVRRLEAAGAVCVGALNMDEYAYGFTTENSHVGPTCNPHDLARLSGGSSGGSAAAVAAGQVPLTLGSDTNGSIRVPDSLCGVFGLKPTYGRLPRTGSYPFVASLDHLCPFARSVADLALGLMLSASRQLPAADRFVRNGQWLQVNMPLARKMSGARLGIVGMGRIGQAIAQRALGFNMGIAYTARSAKSALPYAYHPSAEALAANVDFLVVITPGGAGTRHLINAAVLKALGPKGFLVNVARGSVVDEQALIEALEAGTIAGAGLDVFEDEPRVPQRLLDLHKVVLTPHIGSATAATRQAMADLAFNNLAAHLGGRPVLTPVPECQ
jgi:hypothetical protein